MRRMVWIGALVVVIALIAVAVWWLGPGARASQASLSPTGMSTCGRYSFPSTTAERIAAVLVQEGDRVRKGQLVARLDARRLEASVAQAEAEAAAERQVVQRLRLRPSRTEEIAQARANVKYAKADAVNARQQYERVKSAAELSAGRAVRQQDVDSAKAALQVAEAKLAVNDGRWSCR